MAKKKAEKNFVSSIEELASLVEEIGKDTDNAPVSLDRGSYVEGSLSFGSLVIDLITGGGKPPGKITNVYGPEGGSKSTLAGHLIASATRNKVPVFFFDHEASSDSKYFRALGIRIRMPDGSKNPYFFYYQPNTAEQSYRTMARILRRLPDYTPTLSGGRPLPQALFVIDSIQAMLPGAVEENDEKVRMAASAAVHSLYLPLIKVKLGRKNVSLFATNQTRLNPGQMFGSPEYEPGGQAWRFYPDLKFRVSAVKQPFVERNRFMRFVNIMTKKNKQFPPFLECKDTLTVAFGRGYDRYHDGLGYLTLTGQIEGTIKKRIVMDIEEEFDWNNGKHFSKDEMAVVCSSNEFRRVCRDQLESDKAYNLFFAANDWDSLYDEFDEESAWDLQDSAETSIFADMSSNDVAEEADPAPVRKKKTTRKKRKPKPALSMGEVVDLETPAEVSRT